MLPDMRDEAQLRAAFRWSIPPHYNIGVDVCDRWAITEPDRPAIFEVAPDGAVKTATYGQIRDASNQLANALRALGITRGDRIAILLPQAIEVAQTHMAVYKSGAIALPLAALFGVDALAYRLEDAGARALITNAAGLEKIRKIVNLPSTLELILSIDGADGNALDYHSTLAAQSTHFIPVNTLADDPAMMIYTSGTTGHPKGALHAHRVLLGHLPGVQLPHDFFPQPGDRMWTPADWAWAGGLLNGLLPSMHFGVPTIARKFDKFDPEEAFSLMERMQVRNTFVPPTALRMLRAVKNPRQHFKLALRTVASGGEALGAETFAWGQEQLGLTINEFYGQTECNLVLGSSAALGMVKAGLIGKPIPGHQVAIIRDDGTRCEVGELGQIAVHRPDPVMFLSYWNKPEATAEKFIGDWMTTGDQGEVDQDGFIRFIGRDDDVITSAGYRIGPTEIEDSLMQHPAIALAAVVGKPDPLRTEIVKAFVVVKPGFDPSPALASEIGSFVKSHLSAHEYPREVEFIHELPLTTTGKVIRRLLRNRA
jgi:acetyl-CoA synthetase